MSIQVFGTAVARGVAIGRAVIAVSSRVGVAHYFVDQEEVSSETERLRVSRDRVLSELDHLKRDLPRMRHRNCLASSTCT